MGKAAQSDETMRGRFWAAWDRLRTADADHPVAAIELAETCGIAGKHETKRRRVREIMVFAREHLGIAVEANGGGYWAKPAEIAAYSATRRGRAKGHFAAVKRMNRRVCERRTGQRVLFE
ncbi:MAG: hypothetical protein AABZ47_07915 [Planctomycetota bacterium]